MTYQNYQTLIGFDHLLDDLKLQSAQTYPPYNIIRLDEETYSVEIAVAGFTKSDLIIEVKDSVLSITGELPKLEVEDDYIHKGISTRKFVRKFTLGEYVQVKNSYLDHGLLSITLIREVPEERKPRRIAID